VFNYKYKKLYFIDLTSNQTINMLGKNELKKTDIFKLCRSLDKQEATKCLVFLTEFTNATKKCRILYEEIYKLYKCKKCNWENVNISLSDLNQKIFGKAGDNNAARVLRSELYKNLKRYCNFLEFQKKERLNECSKFLEYLSARKEDDLFFKEFAKIEKSQENKIGIDFTHVKYKNYQAYLELVLKDQSKKNQLDYNLNYQNFYNYAIIQKVQNYCLALNHHLIKNQKVTPEIEKEVELLFEISKQIPSIKKLVEIYETASLMMKNSEYHYTKLKEYLNDLENNISKNDKKFLYVFMHNFCIRSNNPNLKNETRINHLNQFEQGLLHDGEYISLMNAKVLCTTILNLTNIPSESAKLSKEAAIEKIKLVVKEMPPKHRKSTEYFHLAILDYYFKDYKAASEKLKDSPKYANAFFDFDARMVLQRCYYFMEDIDEFNKGIRNFQSALKNDRDLSEKHKTEYFNFTKAIQILQNAKLIFDKNDKKKLLEKLEVFLQEHPVKVLNWFNGQIQGIVQK